MLRSKAIFDAIANSSKYINILETVFIDKDDGFYYYANKTAKGKNLKSFTSSDNEDIFKQVGRSVAEIHNYKAYSDLGKVALKTYKIQAKIEQFCNEDPLSKCCMLKSDLIDFAAKQQNLSYVHGDLNLDNIFIDISLPKSVTYIDIESLAEHIFDGHPVGIPEYELQQFISSLRHAMHASGTDEHLFNAYSRSFLSGYYEIIKPGIVSAKNSEFFKNYWQCRSY